MDIIPGQWIGNSWLCSNQPPDTSDKYFFCCPDGYKSISRKSVQSAGTNWKNIKTTRMLCKADPDLMACGPKPTGDVICCPQERKWRSNKGAESCPMPEVRQGADAAFLARLQLQTGAQGSQGTSLTMLGIPFLIAIAALTYFIFVK